MSDKKILIIPDTHNRWELFEKIVKQESPDLIISLGDAFDDFNDTPQDIIATAEWFHWSVNQKNRIHIAGNHDLHYWFKDNDHMRCSGYDQYKSFIINDFITKKDWEKLVFFYNLDNKWLLTHAGFHPSWIDPSLFKPNKILEYSITKACNRLQNESNDAKKALYRGGNHWFAMPGFTRSYDSPYYGGLTWCDWNKEFHPVRGLHQILGHTPNFKLTWNILKEGEDKFKSLPLRSVNNPSLTDKNSYNICLDSQPGSKYYAIYENGNLTIHETTKLLKK